MLNICDLVSHPTLVDELCKLTTIDEYLHFGCYNHTIWAVLKFVSLQGLCSKFTEAYKLQQTLKSVFVMQARLAGSTFSEFDSH